MPKLVIVESPAKAKTISGYLGSEYIVDSSYGHILDLPKSGLAVDTENGFTPEYEVPDKAKAHVTRLKKALKQADELLLATDEDREGEAISAHLVSVLNPKVPVKRMVFHEITKSAILEAIEHSRDIDQNMVAAQEGRRVLDRLVERDRRRRHRVEAHHEPRLVHHLEHLRQPAVRRPHPVPQVAATAPRDHAEQRAGLVVAHRPVVGDGIEFFDGAGCR